MKDTYLLIVKHIETNETKSRHIELDEETYESCLKRLNVDENGYMLIYIKALKK